MSIGMIEIAAEAAREGLLPGQILRRIGLHGYSEADLERAVEEFAGRVEVLRRFFTEQRLTKAKLPVGSSTAGA